MDFNIRFPSRRSNVMGLNGMVATSHPLAVQAGVEVLKRGGNAIDAAIATAATLCVVEPCSTGIGGDAFALIWSAKEKQLVGLNASGPAPVSLTSDYVRQQGFTQFPTLGGLSVTVPGSLRGWELALSKYGTRPLQVILRSAIEYAENGFPVTETIAEQWAKSEMKMTTHVSEVVLRPTHLT
eukprot:GHVN01003879.1.p1 GENE.GHVN01003879.1~~GHVN01003879.1.p1  ORF type:complete len:182 (+),score=32.89 GHVN01003879.1:459-1004(+)